MYILHKWGINRNLSNRFLNFRFPNDIPFTVYDNDIWLHNKIFSLTKWWCVAQPCIDGLKSIQFIMSSLLLELFLVETSSSGLAKSAHLDEKLINFDEVGLQAFAS